MSSSSTHPPITFVTGNANKLREVKQIMKHFNFGIDFNSMELDLPELQGKPKEVAIEKCKIAMKYIDGPVMVEDVSLCFNALNGLPGVYIKWFLKDIGHEGLNKMLDGFDDRTAYAQCTIAYNDGISSKIRTFTGRTHGMIVRARGDNHFGWDPIFEVNNIGKTYAELDTSTKNTISHRSRALEKFIYFIDK